MNQLASIWAFMLPPINVPFWEIVIKSSLAIALAALACRFLNRQAAALRHRVWVFGLAASLVVPMLSGVLPHFTLPVRLSTLHSSKLVTTRDSQPHSRMHTAESSRPDSPGGFTADSITRRAKTDTQSNTAISADAPQSNRRSEELTSPLAGILGIEQVCVIGWLLGTLIGSTLFVVSLASQWLRLSRLPRIDDDGWAKSVAAARKAIGLRRPIVALESDDACIPAVVGVSPRLVVPSNWRTWSQSQRHCILLHELAHVKRRDVVAQLLGRLTLLVYWFNPFVWHAVKQLRVERELASDDCVLLAGQAASDYAEQLLCTIRCYRPVRLEVGVTMAHSARLDQRVLAILDPMRRRDPVSFRFTIILVCIVGAIGAVLGGFTLTTPVVVANPQAESKIATAVTNASQMWKENFTVEYPGTLPVSVAFSADGKTLLTGDTAGEVMALIFANDEPSWRWKSKVEGSHAAVAFSADQKQVYATTEHGVRILDAALGKEQGRIEVKDKNPTAIGVFPNKTIAEQYIRSQIVFGTPRGYFIKSWAEGKLPDTVGTIETSTVRKDAKPADEAAVPLAIDPQGRSAVMTGPIDATGQAGGIKGKNVLWAYVCGDYEKGSPGNRVMPGHTATVVSAAWAKKVDTAVTGDAAGRVIVWDTKTMNEARRLEVGGRVAALAISDDGTRAAAYVFGKQGELYVWDTAKPIDGIKPIHTELGDFGSQQAFASLSFSPDGRQLAGCAIDKQWSSRLGKVIGKVRVWELSAEPKAQLPPKHIFMKQLPKGSGPNLVILNNDSLLVPAEEQGAVDFRNMADGHIQTRIVLGKFTIGTMKLSTDRKWLAFEQHPPKKDSSGGVSTVEFEVGVYEAPLRHKATIPSCSQLLDIASNGKIVAVVREKQIELWDIATTKKLKAAPFQHKRIDAASFSPDGQLLAISDHNELVLWRWAENTHEQIDLGRRIGALDFSPDGKFLSEGPTPGENIQLRDVATHQVVQTLANTADQSMNVPRLAYAQSGRVLIACDNNKPVNETAMPYRMNLWDTADGSLAHRLKIPAGLPIAFDVSPNGRYLVALIEDSDGMKLSGWRLDGVEPTKESVPTPPAAASPR